jgi:UDP-N-acetylmuramyl pentapeptide phosphotransferase/UDP-N-acetylglucosamine-1-phosphate transferase
MGLISYQDLSFWFVLIPLIIIGVIDDHLNVTSSIRYLIQLISAIIAVYLYHSFPQPWLTNTGNIGELIAFLLTIIGFTALVNFYNFMDGLDGLVAGCSVIQLGFLAIYFNQPLWWLLVAAILGFLCWNWDKAKIFMGDSGSTFLGAIIPIILLNSNHNTVETWSALTITFPIIMDAIYTLICRLLRRENIFKAHRTHLFQRLEKSGWNHSQVALSYMTINILIVISIVNFGKMAAWGSLCGIIILIILAEIYLSQLKIQNF